MVIQTNLKCELQKAVRVQYLNGNLFSQDNQGNQINVEVLDGGSPATLSGTVSANVIRADGGTVAVSSGSFSGNIASVVLPSAAYAVPGVVSIIIKITSSSVITTLAAVVANVYQSSTDSAIDPGTIIPSIQTLISSIETAVASIPADYSSLWASLAPAFNSNNNYTAGQYVTYSGSVYMFNTNHSGSWSSSDVSAVDIGDQLSQLKNAFNAFLVQKTEIPFISGSINRSTGVTINSTTRIRTTSYLPIVDKLVSSFGYSFLVYAYTSAGVYVGTWDSDNKAFAIGAITWVKEFDFYLINNSYQYMIVLRKDDDSSIDTTSASNAMFYVLTDSTLSVEDKAADAKATGDKLALINSSFDNIYAALNGSKDSIDIYTLNDISTFESGAINSSGADLANVSSYRTGYYIPVNEYTQIASEVTLTTTPISATPYMYIVYYDKNKAFLSRDGGSFTNTKKISSTPPENAKYIRISLTYVGDGNVSSYSLRLYYNVVTAVTPREKWYILGDSISAGYYSMTESMAQAAGITMTYISPVTTDQGETTGSVWDSSLTHNYWGYANKYLLNAELVGDAYPGQGYFRTASNSQNGIYVVKNTDFSDAGLITVAWGFNDWHYNLQRGNHDLIDASVPYPTANYDTSQITTVNQAIWFCLGELIRKAPQAKIVVQTPMNGWAYGGDWASNWGIGYSMSNSGKLSDIHDDIVYWANYYGLQILEMTYNNSIVNRRNIKDTIIDGSHPSDAAHQRLGRHVALALFNI